MKIKTRFSQKPLGHFNQILYVSFQVQRNENLLWDAGHMTKMAVMPLYGKKTLQKFSRESLNRLPRIFACSIGDHSLFKL